MTGLWLLPQYLVGGVLLAAVRGAATVLREGSGAVLSVAVRPAPCCSWCMSSAAQSVGRQSGPAACAPVPPPSPLSRPRPTELTSCSLPAGRQQHSPDVPHPAQHQAAGRATCRPVPCHRVERQSPAASASQPQGSGARHCPSCSCGAPTHLTIRLPCISCDNVSEGWIVAARPISCALQSHALSGCSL